MTDFSKNWEMSGNNKNYLDIADIILQDRQRLIKIVLSYMNYFLGDEDKSSVLDLGCGDGILTKYIFSRFPNLQFTVCDGSSEMLNKAKKNLSHIRDCVFLSATFDDIQNNKSIDKKYDFIVSSFAIHHINHDQKYNFFEKLYSLLNKGGHFINIDTCLGSNNLLDEWYYSLWREWIIEMQEIQKLDKDYSDIPANTPKKPENHYQDLDTQIQWLKSIGYRDVDCHYKYGLFCIYSGRK